MTRYTQRPGGPTGPPGHMTRCSHRGTAGVQVGPFVIYAAGTHYLRTGDLERFNLLVPLTPHGMPLRFGQEYRILAGHLVDMGGVPENWRDFLECVVDALKKGDSVLAFCMASHGRTGCLLASLIALLESVEETPDPIAAVRARHCERAVETLAQAEAIFALRGQDVPKVYRDEFKNAYAQGTMPYAHDAPQP